MSETSTLISHLIELRQRLMRCIIASGVAFLLLMNFANPLYTHIATPLLAQLPEQSSMIATEVAAPFLAPFKLTLFLSVALVMPFILYQAWGFIAPGLYSKEKRFALPVLVSSVVLFYLGIAFAYFVVLPLLFAFLVTTAPEGVAVMTDISRYLDFIIKLFFAFGLAFEVPVITCLCIASGLVSADSLAEKRPYIIIAAFVFGMLLTPPDIISQTLLAVPMWLLFELGLFISRQYLTQASEDEVGKE